MKHTASRSWTRAATTLFACLLSVIALCVASDGSVPSVPWSAASPVTWSLFQCPPPADAIHRSEAAAIHMTIEWRASYSLISNGGDWAGYVQSVTVTNSMQPSLSWVVPGKATSSILEHEQAHFDLNEVFRRKLEALLPCLQAKHPTKQGAIDSLNDALHQRANEVLSELQVAQARYDAETRHGNDTAAQARWEAQIALWLLDPTAAH